MIFKSYYKRIIKRDLLNKFYYKSKNQIPRLDTIKLHVSCPLNTLNALATTLLALELISFTQGRVIKSKTVNLQLKIKKGQPIGCIVILKKAVMYEFLTKLNFELLPNFKDFKGITFKKRKDFKNNSLTLTLKQLPMSQSLKPHFYLFNALNGLNLNFLSTSRKKGELMYLLKQLKLPFQRDLQTGLKLQL